MNNITPLRLIIKLWVTACLLLSGGIGIYFVVEVGGDKFFACIHALIISLIGSTPAFAALVIALPVIKKLFKVYILRIIFFFSIIFFLSIVYGGLAGVIIETPFSKYSSFHSFLITTAECTGGVLAAVIIACIIYIKFINLYFSSTNKINLKMEAHSNQSAVQTTNASSSNKIWIKGLITGGLILLMLIPTVFVFNLIQERQQRQQEVKLEVSSKWAGEQNITFPYLYIPYTLTTTQNNKIVMEQKSFFILPDNLNVSGSVTTEQRQRSIYTVLLYNSSLNAKGNFNIQVPADVDTSTIKWNEAKICLGISDFKGIEQKIAVVINNKNYDFSASLPSNEIDSTGLSAPIELSANDLNKSISFQLPLKIKGSDQLHFTPLAGNSQFNLSSNWGSPSFDGNTLPGERDLDKQGFQANWSFSKANLPFNTTIKNFNFKKDDYAFGVTLLQPADQYAKTLRCVKYAILFIGLTYSLFFVIEIMQKKPFHPMQYVLVGLALIVFFTLLLSISEFMLFDVAYLIASLATILLITLYSKSHFNSWKIAGVFAATITSIYGFIYVLISLEDTALLVGSIGLFVILALAMYGSRKINWYGNNLNQHISI